MSSSTASIGRLRSSISSAWLIGLVASAACCSPRPSAAHLLICALPLTRMKPPWASRPRGPPRSSWSPRSSFPATYAGKRCERSEVELAPSPHVRRRKLSRRRAFANVAIAAATLPESRQCTRTIQTRGVAVEIYCSQEGWTCRLHGGPCERKKSGYDTYAASICTEDEKATYIVCFMPKLRREIVEVKAG